MPTHTTVFKSVQEDERLVFAEVYAPLRPDSDGEFMDAEGIKKMAYEFMQRMELDSVDSYHNNDLVPGCCVVESFIARKGDPDFIEGSWVVGMHVNNDDMWEKIKKGEINGFSMEAIVQKEVCPVEMDIPPVVQGKTFKNEADGHDHTFYVSYNEDGKFLGGRTDAGSDGHYHTIKRGSVTDMAADHTHRFSHLDNVVMQTSVSKADMMMLDDSSGDLCPIATTSLEANVQNHLLCIKLANLGPADPREPSNDFWAAKAKKWGVEDGEARTRLCMNCEHYIATTKVQECMKGPGGQAKASDLPVKPKWADIQGMPKAVCSRYNITCSALRTCDDWEEGGPITDATSTMEAD